MTVLLLRLAAPLQSWGTGSRFVRRNTDRMPSRSGVIGLLAAAHGRRRTDPIEDLLDLRIGVRIEQPGRLERDFQTARSRDGATAMPLVVPVLPRRRGVRRRRRRRPHPAGRSAGGAAAPACSRCSSAAGPAHRPANSTTASTTAPSRMSCGRHRGWPPHWCNTATATRTSPSPSCTTAHPAPLAARSCATTRSPSTHATASTAGARLPAPGPASPTRTTGRQPAPARATRTRTTRWRCWGS